MGGLGWWAQTQWVQRQRRLWREHDAKLAAAWRDDATGEGADDSETDIVIVLPDVIVLPEAGSSVGAGVS